MKSFTPVQTEIMKSMLDVIDSDNLNVIIDVSEFEYDDVVAVLKSNIEADNNGKLSVAALTKVYAFNDDEDEVTITFNGDALKLLTQIHS